MNMSTVYSNRHLVPTDHVAYFEEHRKTNLSTLEYLGLEAILCAFVDQYEEEVMGEKANNLADYTRWNENGSIDILDGVYDTYIFGNYAISEIWVAFDGCIMLSCYELEHEEYDDPWDIVINTDWQSECKPVLFRLD